jgi:hypothetical protein
MEKPQITVAELEAAIEELFTLRLEHAKADRIAKDLKNELTEKQINVMAKLELLELDSYKGKAGSFSFRMKEGFRVPKDLETKKQFFAYLEEKGVFDELVSVNSMSLNSWAQAEIEAAHEAGNFDFTLPGLEKSAPRPSFTMVQSKGQK